MAKLDNVTTRTIVAKTEFVDSDKKFRINIEQCLQFFATKVSNTKINGSILQIRTGFKNAFTCEMYFNRPISIKICKNGSFQFTGCITLDNAHQCITYILNLLKELYSEKLNYKIIIYEVMSNFCIDLNHRIDHVPLLTFLNNQEEFSAFCSPSCFAVNCKYKISVDRVLDRKVSVYDEFGFLESKTFRQCMTEKEISEDSIKDYYITFLVFKSGKVIVSGINEIIIESICNKFVDLMHIYFKDNSIMEKINTDKKPVKKRNHYDKIVLIKIEDSEINKQYILIRGQKHYISSRIKKLYTKHGKAEIVFDEQCNSLHTFKILKENLRHEPGIKCNNVVITLSVKQSSETRLLDLVKECNIE